MVLGHLGRGVDMGQILGFHNGVTDIQTGLALLAHFGLEGCYEINGGFDNNDKLVIALIHDNGYANPDVHGTFEHFIVVYAQDVNNIYAANPWGARDIAYPLSQFNPAYIAGIVIPVSANKAGSPAPSPPPAPIPGGTGVSNEAAALVRLAYESTGAFLNSGGMTQNQMSYGVGLIDAAGGNADAGISQIMDHSDEWNAVRALFAQLRTLPQAVGALQDQVNHIQLTPGPPGPPGPPGNQVLVSGGTLTPAPAPAKTGIAKITDWLPNVTTLASLVSTGATWLETAAHNVSPGQAVTLTAILAAVARGATAVENALGK